MAENADHLRRQEENNFYSLSMEILNEIIQKYELSYDVIRTAIISIIESFKYKENHRFREADYSRIENICGYLYRYGAHGAGLTRFKVLEVFPHCPALRMTLRDAKEPLHVVSLGSGPGNDVLGFCSALQELGFPEERGLNITVVDAVSQWEECIDRMIRFAEEGQFGNVSQLFRSHRHSLEIVQYSTRLPACSETSSYKALENADIILVSQLLSIVIWDDVPIIMQNIRSAMKEDALVLLIDKPPVELVEGRLIYNRNDYFFDGFEVLYLSEKTAYHTLSGGPQEFGFRSNITSNAWIAILRKTPLP